MFLSLNNLIVAKNPEKKVGDGHENILRDTSDFFKRRFKKKTLIVAVVQDVATKHRYYT